MPINEKIMDFKGLYIKCTGILDDQGEQVLGDTGILDGVLGSVTPAAATVTTLTAGGAVVLDGGTVTINEASGDYDFRVESNGNANAIFVDAGNDRVGILNGSPAVALDVTGAITASTTVTGTTGTFGTVTNTAINVPMTVRQSADVVKDDGAAASALTGLSVTVVPGTYKYKANLQTLSTANGGAKVTMVLTTAVLTSLQNVARAFTASAVACARSTTATSGATLYGATAAITQIELEGTMVVSTGGTIALHGEQNASHADETTFYTGSTLELVRIA